MKHCAVSMMKSAIPRPHSPRPTRQRPAHGSVPRCWGLMWRASHARTLMSPPTLLLPFLLLCLSGCGTAPAPIVTTRTEVQVVLPDPNLLTQEPEPLLSGDDTAALLDVWITTRAALATCNGRLQALAQWRTDHDNAAPAPTTLLNGEGGPGDHP